MKVIVWAAIAVLAGFLSIQLYRMYFANGEADAKLSEVNIQLEKLKTENEQLKADISYYAEPENIAKELKGKFDYKKPGEKLIKIQ